VATTREVVALVRDLAGLDRRTRDARATFRRDYVDLEDGHASARLVDAVFGLAATPDPTCRRGVDVHGFRPAEPGSGRPSAPRRGVLPGVEPRVELPDPVGPGGREGGCVSTSATTSSVVPASGPGAVSVNGKRKPRTPEV